MKWSVVVLCLVSAGCSGEAPYEEGGSSYAKISADKNNRCKVMVSDMGRANPLVKPFSAIIEGCEPENRR